MQKLHAFAFGFFCSAGLFASVLPGSLLVQKDTSENSTSDSNLFSWIERHSIEKPFHELQESELQKKLDGFDDSAKNFFKARYHRMRGNKREWQAKLRDLRASLTTEGATKDLLFSDYETEELYISNVEQNAHFNTTRNQILAFQSNSCPKKRLMSDVLSTSSFLKNEPGNAKALIEDLSQVRDTTFKKAVFLRMLPLLPQSKTPPESLQSLAKEFLGPDDDRYLWLHPGPSKNNDIEKTAKQTIATASSNCVSEQQAFLKNAPSQSLDELMALGKKIEQCLKKQGSRQGIKFWKSAQKALQDTHGFQGWAKAQLSIVQLSWNLDQFDLAKDMLADLLAQARQNNAQNIAADALFMLARIEENQGLYSESSDKFKVFIKSYPQDSRLDQVYALLALIYIGQSEWAKVGEVTTKIIHQEEELPPDSRQVSRLGFALFWGGRAHLEQGDQQKAIDLWSRLASEFYSTYYGALGHYVVEQMDGRVLALQPSKTKAFEEDSFFNGYSPEQTARFLRIKAFLNLGLLKDAKCEISEIASDKDMKEFPEAETIKALFLHLAGDWMQSIKIFGDIPRSYRKTLPQGMEVLLFPKKFDDIIERYAKALAVDPDFVVSLIRQESVFNPKAKSQAGAMGLMQLMQTTALIEAKKLTKTSLKTEMKSEILQKTKSSNSLYQLDTNIILGTNYLNSLLQRYQSPVFSLSAYNAGPTATTRWLKKYPTDDVLYFIEKIPYSETRDYVKLILRNYFYYKKWYGPPSVKPLPHLEAATKGILKFKEKL